MIAWRGLWTRVSDHLLAARNRLLSSQRFQRWAARFVLTRWVARRRASALFDLCAGFVYSQVLQAVVRLRLLEAEQGEPRTVAELAPALGLPEDAAQRLLDAAASLRLVERRGARYGLGIHGCSYLGNPGLARLVEHHAMLYRDLADPIALLRGEVRDAELNRFWAYASRRVAQPTVAEVAPYSELMASSMPLLVEDILEAYPVERHRRLLDVGGGEGAFVEAVAARAPQLSLTLFDLPPVAERACERLAGAGLASRVTVVHGDLFRDPLPPDADLVSLVRVLHDHDDDRALRLLQAIRRALRPGGVLLVAEPMRGTTGAEAMGDAYFGFYLLAMGQGRPRSPQELMELLQRAGFARARLRRTRRPILLQVLSAEVAE
jgi:demethylspheroidene O-methyltransferase